MDAENLTVGPNGYKSILINIKEREISCVQLKLVESHFLKKVTWKLIWDSTPEKSHINAKQAVAMLSLQLKGI